jgi:hypothetical protein
MERNATQSQQDEEEERGGGGDALGCGESVGQWANGGVGGLVNWCWWPVIVASCGSYCLSVGLWWWW